MKLVSLTIFFLAMGVNTALSTELKIAVASNFSKPIKELIKNFEKETQYKVQLAIGSSGKHFAQIVHGAPFHIFMSADKKRPQLLEEKEIGVRGSVRTYALGRLVLWTPQKGMKKSSKEIFKNLDFKFLAIANPKLAPYGALAKTYLNGLGIWNKLQSKIVQGQNINQTLQFVDSGNAEYGLVAFSQVKKLKGTIISLEQLEENLIEQQLILLKKEESSVAFLEYLSSKRAKEIIRAHGYEVRP